MLLTLERDIQTCAMTQERPALVERAGGCFGTRRMEPCFFFLVLAQIFLRYDHFRPASWLVGWQTEKSAFANALAICVCPEESNPKKNKLVQTDFEEPWVFFVLTLFWKSTLWPNPKNSLEYETKPPFERSHPPKIKKMAPRVHQNLAACPSASLPFCRASVTTPGRQRNSPTWPCGARS